MRIPETYLVGISRSRMLKKTDPSSFDRQFTLLKLFYKLMSVFIHNYLCVPGTLLVKISKERRKINRRYWKGLVFHLITCLDILLEILNDK